MDAPLAGDPRLNSRSAPTSIGRLSAFLYRRRGLKLAALLGPPMGWMLVVYLGALTILLITAFWTLNPLTTEIQRTFTLDNFKILIQDDVYRRIAVRTFGIALAVTLVDTLLAFPIAYYTARIARPRVKTALLLSVTLPLWAGYLVRVYAWRTILAGTGLLNWSLDKLHLGSLSIGYSNWAIAIVFSYMWLPYVVLPIFAALERIPASYVDASGDLGARFSTTLRRVILPIALPGIVAGSIFSFSLTLGDYIVPQLVGNTLFIGNVIYQSAGVTNNIPFAAAYALVPVAIVALYLTGAKRLGAFEAL